MTVLTYVCVSNDHKLCISLMSAEHEQCYLAINVSQKISFSDMQDILSIRTVIHGPAQVDNFIRTDIKNFPETFVLRNL